jgi:hypothetical protein
MDGDTTGPARAGGRAAAAAARIETSLTKIEQEWKTRIHNRLLEVIDLSLIASEGQNDLGHSRQRTWAGLHRAPRQA